MRNVTPKKVPIWAALADEDDTQFWFQNGVTGLAAFIALVVATWVTISYMVVVSPLRPDRTLAGDIAWSLPVFSQLVIAIGIAVLISVIEHGGWHKAAVKAKGAGGRRFVRLLCLLCFVAGMFAAIQLQMHHLTAALNRFDVNQARAENLLTEVGGILDTTNEQAAVDEAQEALADARAEREIVRGWRTVLEATRPGVYSAELEQIQLTITGRRTARGESPIPVDGLAQGVVAGCAECGATTDAVARELQLADAAVTQAETARAAARQALQAQEQRGGEATDITEDALMARIADSSIHMLLGAAEWMLRAQNPERLQDAAETPLEGSELAAAIERFDGDVRRLAVGMAFIVAFILALIPNGASFGLGNFLRDPPEPDEALGDGRDIDETGRLLAAPDAPQGPSGAALRGAEVAAAGEPGDPRFKSYIAAGAPRQPWETRAAYTARLHEETEELNRMISEMDAERDNEMRAADDHLFIERKRNIAAEKLRRKRLDELERQERELGLAPAEPEPLPAPEPPKVPEVAAPPKDDALERRLDRLTSAVEGLVAAQSAPPTPPAPPPAPKGPEPDRGASAASSAPVNVHVHTGQGNGRGGAGPIVLNLRDGENEDQAIHRARRMADESAVPVLVDGAIMVWPDGYVLDTRKPKANRDERWRQFQGYLNDVEANGGA